MAIIQRSICLYHRLPAGDRDVNTRFMMSGGFQLSNATAEVNLRT